LLASVAPARRLDEDDPMAIRRRSLRIGQGVICIATLASAFAAGCAAMPAQAPVLDQSRLRVDVERVLWWLPEDAQTVFVMQRPFPIPQSLEYPLHLEMGLALWATAPLLALSETEPRYREQVVGQTVLLAVLGNKRFREPPSGEGIGPYEGCFVLLFDETFRPAGDALMAALETEAKQKLRIDNLDVLLLEEPTFQFITFFARPENNVLVVANCRSVLEDVLGRMKQRGKHRALPGRLPEWKHVDTSAAFWALRHYDRSDADEDPSSPLGSGHLQVPADPGAIGLTFQIGGRSEMPTVRYLSSSENALELASEFWTYPPGAEAGTPPTVRSTLPGAVEITVRSGDPGDAGYFPMYLLAAFGHVIYGM
jgi:hypothetical protein